GGVQGADAHCHATFGEEDETQWKALLAGGGRRASVAPNAGDEQLDWVLQPYAEYYNWEGRLIWATDATPLLGVDGGVRVDLLAPLFDAGSFDYPWTGLMEDWTTAIGGTCEGWTVPSMEIAGAFADAQF